MERDEVPEADAQEQEQDAFPEADDDEVEADRVDRGPIPGCRGRHGQD